MAVNAHTNVKVDNICPVKNMICQSNMLAHNEINDKIDVKIIWFWVLGPNIDAC